MFRYCVWYLLRPKHPINRLIEQNAKLLDSVVFPAHVTIQHSIATKDEALQIASRFENHKVPEFTFFSYPYVSRTTVDYNNFYAIEQSLLVNQKKTKSLHISLAYSDRDITDMELVCCSPENGMKILTADVEVAVFDCHDKNPCKWVRV